MNELITILMLKDYSYLYSISAEIRFQFCSPIHLFIQMYKRNLLFSLLLMHNLCQVAFFKSSIVFQNTIVSPSLPPSIQITGTLLSLEVRLKKKEGIRAFFVCFVCRTQNFFFFVTLFHNLSGMPSITGEIRGTPYGNYICHTIQGGMFQLMWKQHCCVYVNKLGYWTQQGS